MPRRSPEPFSSSLTVFSSPLSRTTCVFQSFAQGPLPGSSALGDGRYPPSEPRAVCSRPAQPAFSLKDPDRNLRSPRKILTEGRVCRCFTKRSCTRCPGRGGAATARPVCKGFLTGARIAHKQLAAAPVYRVSNCSGRCITE